MHSFPLKFMLPMVHRAVLILLSGSLLFVQYAVAACYWPSGAENNDTRYAPVTNDSSNPLSTICCAKWDIALPNGLCQTKEGRGIWRETCTKSNWDDGGCQEMCSTESLDQMNKDQFVTPCTGAADSITWCCGESNRCCDDRSGITRYTIAQKFGDPIPTDISSTASPGSPENSSVVSTPTTTPSTLGPVTASEGNDLSTGAKAGIGVGAGVGAIALMVLGIFIAKALRWREKARHGPPSSQEAEQLPAKDLYRYRYEREPAQLAGMESQVHEMYGSGTASELQGVRT